MTKPNQTYKEVILDHDCVVGHNEHGALFGKVGQRHRFPNWEANTLIYSDRAHLPTGGTK